MERRMSGGSGEEAHHKRIVLIPIDGSEHSERAFAWYAENLTKDGDLVVFVHVVEPVYAGPAVGLAMETPPILMDDMTRVMQESITSGKALGHAYMQKAKSISVHSKAFIHVDTKPGPALVNSVKEHQANLVVMGNRGSGTLRRTFLGSVSDHVLHHAHVPVVVVPPEHKPQQPTH